MTQEELIVVHILLGIVIGVVMYLIFAAIRGKDDEPWPH